MNDDDDAPADPREQAEAARLARLVDGLLAGEPLPPAMAAEQRALVETAQAIRAGVTLPESRRDALIDAALRRRPRTTVWIGATALAAAAALVLALRPAPRPPLPPEMLSRPSDALVGQIDAARAGAARDRADLVYADRLAGWRQLVLAGGAR